MYDIQTIRRWVRHVGVRPVAEISSGWVATRIVRAGIGRYAKPSLDDHLDLAGPFETITEGFLQALGIQPDHDASEFDSVGGDLENRYSAIKRAFPGFFGVERETGRFLYQAVRALRPSVVVETGVADGLSSYLILAALRRNGHGHLHSFDIDPNAGRLVEDRSRWTLTISPADAPEATFKRALGTLGPIDVFFHDADHRYMNQIFEYQTVWPLMRSGGLFASDDIDDSRAFIHHCRALDLRPAVLFDRRKLVGAVRV